MSEIAKRTVLNTSTGKNAYSAPDGKVVGEERPDSSEAVDAYRHRPHRQWERAVSTSITTATNPPPLPHVLLMRSTTPTKVALRYFEAARLAATGTPDDNREHEDT